LEERWRRMSGCLAGGGCTPAVQRSELDAQARVEASRLGTDWDRYRRRWLAERPTSGMEPKKGNALRRRAASGTSRPLTFPGIGERMGESLRRRARRARSAVG
jgi:hypothetical protein